MTQFEKKVTVWRKPLDDARGQYHPKAGQGNLIRMADGNMCLTLMNDNAEAGDPLDFVSMGIGGMREARGLRDALNEFIAEAESAEVKA